VSFSGYDFFTVFNPWLKKKCIRKDITHLSTKESWQRKDKKHIYSFH